MPGTVQRRVAARSRPGVDRQPEDLAADARRLRYPARRGLLRALQGPRHAPGWACVGRSNTAAAERGYRALQQLVERDPWKGTPYPPEPGIPEAARGHHGGESGHLRRAALLISGVDRWARAAWVAYAALQPLAREWVQQALALDRPRGGDVATGDARGCRSTHAPSTHAPTSSTARSPRRWRARAAWRRARHTRRCPPAAACGRALGWRRLRPFVEQRRVDVAREDRAGAHAVGPFFGVDLLRQARQAELGRHVGRTGQVACELADVGIDIDDGARGALRAYPGRKARTQ